MSPDSLQQLSEAISELSADAPRLVSNMLEAGVPPKRIVTEGIVPGMREVGRRFEDKSYFLADMLFAVTITNDCFDLLKPALEKEVEKIPTVGRLVIGTVKGDIHDIGKNIFTALMRASGFETYDLGVDVPAEKFAEKAKEVNANIIGASALLSTTAPYFREIDQALTKAGIRDKVLFMIGGPPLVSPEEVGADFHTNDAFKGVQKALEYSS